MRTPEHVEAAKQEATKLGAILIIAGTTRDKHIIGVVKYGEKQRKLFFSTKPTDKAVINICRSDVRRVVREMGGM